MFFQLALCATLLTFTIIFFRRVTASSSTSETKSLTQIPGPKSLPIIGHLHHLFNVLPHRVFHDLATKYGPLVYLRMGSFSAIVVNTPEMAKEFLKNHDLEFSAHNQNAVATRIFHDTSFTFTPIGPYWTMAKKLTVTEFLGNRVLNQLAHLRVYEYKSFLMVLHNKAKLGEEVNFTHEVTKLTTNILSQMMMSIRCSGTEEGAKQALIVHEQAQILGVPNLADVFPILKFFDFQGIMKRCENIQKRYDRWLEGILVEREEVRRKNKEMGVTDKANDFLDILYDVVEDENADVKLTRRHMKGLILDFFTGGTETSATTVEWTLAELINNPRIIKKAQEEIDRVVGRERLVTEADCSKLPYIKALIKEILRLHAPIPVYPRKAVQDCVVMGIKIPVKTVLLINIYSMARDPRYWESPLEFKPERFLNDDATSLRDVKGQDYELLPFGTGRRHCPGINLALYNLHAIVAAIIQCFDWKVLTNNGVVDMEEKGGLAIPRANDLICVPMARIDNLEAIIEKY